MPSLTATFKVEAHTKGANKCTEVDASGQPTIEVMGGAYLRKSAFGTLPIGSTVKITIEV